jgi:RNA polymerase sigma-70 factor (ECF subfamily)
MDSGSTASSPEELLRHAQWVRRLARKLVQDPNVADDVVQQTWLAALEHPPESLARGTANASAERSWLARVVANFVRQRGRAEARRSARETSSARPASASSEPDVVEQVDGQHVVVQEVLQLDEPLRSTLLLRYFKDLSAAEIARRQDVPAATVRSRLARGLEELRERMDARYGGDRSAWCLVLASSIDLVPPAPAPVVPEPSAALTTGTLAGTAVMKTGAILAVAFGTVAITLAGIATLGGGDESSTAEASEPAAVATPVVEEPAPLTQAAEPTAAREPEPERRAPAEVASTPVAEVVAEKEPEKEELPPGLLVFRFVDQGGSAVGDVKVSLLDQEGMRFEVVTSARSDGGGVARLAVPMRSDAHEVKVRYDALGYAPGGERPRAISGQEVQVGSITLEPGVLISGRVTDYEGAPIAGASVFSLDPQLADWPEDQMIRTGPSGLGGGDKDHELTQATTDEFGAFEIAGPAWTLVRLSAGQDGYRWTWTEPLELLPGEPIQGLRIELDELRVEDRIAGIVLDEAGDPLALTYVQYDFQDEVLTVSSGVLTDADGRFDHVVMRKVPHTFTYADGGGTAVARNVMPGTLDVVMQVQSEGQILIIVEDPDGEPVTEYELGYYTIYEGGSTGRHEDVESADGTFGLNPPGDRFRLEISADGFVTQEFGPYDAATCPSSLHCTLLRAAAVRGTVTRDGNPVAGAKVRLWSAVTPGHRYETDGFPTRLVPMIVATGTTDAQGRYSLPIANDGSYAITASKEGAAPGESELLELTAADGRDDVDVELGDGGTLVVIVNAPPGEDPAGVIVGITDAGATRRTTRADENGIARFEILRAGRWIVRESDRELGGGTTSSSSWAGGTYYEIPYNCDVVAGETTEFTLVVE